MSSVDDYQNAEEAVAQQAEEIDREEARRLAAELAEPAAKETALLERRPAMIAMSQLQTLTNMRASLPDLHELALSIKEKGLLQPLEVREVDDEDRPYQVFAGRRRYEALRLLHPNEDTTVRCEITVDLDDDEVYALMFTENAQRRDFTPLEYARGFRLLMNKNPELSAAQLARSLGGDVTAQQVRKHLRLLELPDEVQAMVDSDDLSFTVAELLHRGSRDGQLSDEELIELAEARAAGHVSTDDVRAKATPFRGTVPPKPEGYDEWVREQDAKRGGLSDFEGTSKFGSSSALNDDFGDEPVESSAVDGVVHDSADLPVRAADAGSTEAPADAPAPVRAVGNRQLDCYLLTSAVRLGASAAFLEEHELDYEFSGDADATLEWGNIGAYIWGLADHERDEFARDLASDLLQQDDAPPVEIFPNGNPLR